MKLIKKKEPPQEDIKTVSYHPAKYFHNDLDNESDYYLEIRYDGEKNRFVKKSEVTEK